MPASPLSRYLDIVPNLIFKDLSVRYVGSSLGMLWSLGNPLVTVLVYWFVFTRIFTPTQPNFALYIVCGIVHWTLLAQMVPQSCEWMTSNGNLLRKIFFPRILIPLAGTGTIVLAWVPTLAVLACTWLALGGAISPALLLYPLVLAAYLAFLFGVGLALCVLFVSLRDLKHLSDVVVPLLFWMTPIVWTPDQLPSGVASALHLNPVAPFFRAFEAILHGSRFPDTADLVAASMLALIAVTAGLWCFNARSADIVENL